MAKKKKTKKTEKNEESGSTAVAERPQYEVSPELLDMARDRAGEGNENIGSDDIALPFLRLLQSNSRPLSKRDESYIEGAKAGMFLNTVTGQLYDGEEGVRFIPVKVVKTWNEWIPQDAGGGFIASYETEQEAVASADPKHEIVETANHFILIEDEYGEWTQAIFPLTSTKLKMHRDLNALVNMKKLRDSSGEQFDPPRYMFIYRVRSVETENDKGRFYVPKVEDEGVVDEQLLLEGEKFCKLVQAGEAQVDYSKLDEAGEQVGEEDDGEPGF